MLGAVTHFCVCINHQTMQWAWLHQRTHIFFERMCKSDSVSRCWLENQKESVMQLMKVLDVAKYSLHRVHLVYALHIVQRVHVPLHRVGQGENGEEQCRGEFVWVITGWRGMMRDDERWQRGDKGRWEVTEEWQKDYKGWQRDDEEWLRGWHRDDRGGESRKSDDKGVTEGWQRVEDVKYCCFG